MAMMMMWTKTSCGVSTCPGQQGEHDSVLRTGGRTGITSHHNGSGFHLNLADFICPGWWSSFAFFQSWVPGPA